MNEQARHITQRVCVFVDVQNMYYSAKNLYAGAKVDFGRVLKTGLCDRPLIRAFAYVIRANIDQETDFYSALEKFGYEIRVKDLQVFYGGAKKGDWDVGLCMDAVRLIPKMDVLILVSGDGDYKDLLEYAQSQGVKTEVMAFEKTTSNELLKTADLFIDLGKDPKQYLIAKRTYSKRKPKESKV